MFIKGHNGHIQIQGVKQKKQFFYLVGDIISIMFVSTTRLSVQY